MLARIPEPWVSPAARRLGRRPSRASAPPPEPPWVPPIRLRYLMALVLLGAVGLWTVPRLKAAWRAHSLGATLANYASCMVGPSGPAVLRDRPLDFQRLARRRLMAAPPDDHPFAACAPDALKATGSIEIEHAHQAAARRFREYAVDEDAPLSIAELGVDTSTLVALAKEAWPLLRGSYARLMRPTLGAKEATHPVAPPSPGLGSGLPTERALLTRSLATEQGLVLGVGTGIYRKNFMSTDGGRTFSPKTRGIPAELGPDGCTGMPPSRGLSLSAGERGSLVVTYHDSSAEPMDVTAVSGDHLLLSLDCDASALVLAVKPEGAKQASLVRCAFGRRCAPMPSAKFAPFDHLIADEIDLARVDGATVLSVARNGVVRVVSSRDEGRTWTPPQVAYDAGELTPGNGTPSVPDRLIAVGSRLFLYGAAGRGSERYPLLLSDDQGASFHAPAREAEVERVARRTR